MGVFLSVSAYSHGTTMVAPKCFTLACSFTISRAVPGLAQPMEFLERDAVALTSGGWGIRSVFSAASPSDLEPHLVDGYFMLQATVKAL